MDYDEILPELFLGGCPDSPDDVDELNQEGISAILNLQTDEDFAYLGIDWPKLLAHYVALGIEVRRLPVRDFHDNELRESLPECVRVLDELRTKDHVVYVHCSAGMNRSPSVVICYLHWCLGWCLAEAERYVRKHHNCAPVMEAITLATRDRQRLLEDRRRQP